MLRLELHGAGDLESLAVDFPTVPIVATARTEHALTADAWAADNLDFWAFDRALDELVAADEPLRVCGPTATAHQILIRGQRLAPRRTIAEPWFERVLGELAAQYDRGDPLARAGLSRALDVWQWLLRLEPCASATVQLAALLHDLAPQVRAALLARAGVPSETGRLFELRDAAGEPDDWRALEDAEALSFFSLSSPGYLMTFGPEQTRAQVARSFARMSPRARYELGGVRLPRLVRLQLHEMHGSPRVQRDCSNPTARHP